MPTEYFINLSYTCNEACVFCAADILKDRNSTHPKLTLTVTRIKSWLNESPPMLGDRVMLAGGEPTLHREFCEIVECSRDHCKDITVFTNGLRLSNKEFALAAVRAGVTTFEIALFGATAAHHDDITRVNGSFDRTLAALEVLGELRGGHDFSIVVRLLISKQTHSQNPAIVGVIRRRACRIDAVSLNRLILSDSARDCDATVSWDEARQSINETARLIREAGYTLEFQAIPLCLFDGENATFVSRHIQDVTSRNAVCANANAWQLRYFDPSVAEGELQSIKLATRTALPDPCIECDYRSVCGRVEAWYVRRYGSGALAPVRLSRAVHSSGNQRYEN